MKPKDCEVNRNPRVILVITQGRIESSAATYTRVQNGRKKKE